MGLRDYICPAGSKGTTRGDSGGSRTTMTGQDGSQGVTIAVNADLPRRKQELSRTFIRREAASGCAITVRFMLGTDGQCTSELE